MMKYLIAFLAVHFSLTTSFAQTRFDEIVDQEQVFSEELLTRSETENKPILIYFTGYACVNCRRLENSVLSEEIIYTSLEEDFIFVPLFVDDRTELDEADKYISSIKKRPINTIGEKNSDFQITAFETNTQPYFVVLNSENEVIDTGDFSTLGNQLDCMTFMSKSLKAFHE